MVDLGEYTDTSPMDGMGIASFLLQKMIQPACLVGQCCGR